MAEVIFFELEEEWCKGGKRIGMECVDCVDGVDWVLSRELCFVDRDQIEKKVAILRFRVRILFNCLHLDPVTTNEIWPYLTLNILKRGHLTIRLFLTLVTVQKSDSVQLIAQTIIPDNHPTHRHDSHSHRHLRSSPCSPTVLACPLYCTLIYLPL